MTYIAGDSPSRDFPPDKDSNNLSFGLLANPDARIAELQELLRQNVFETSLGYICLLKDDDISRLEFASLGEANSRPRAYFERLMRFAPLVDSSPALSQEIRSRWLSLALVYDYILQAGINAEIVAAYQRGQELSLSYQRAHPDLDAVDKWADLELQSLALAEIGLFYARGVADEDDPSEKFRLEAASEAAFQEAQDNRQALSPFLRCYVRWTELVSRPFCSDRPGEPQHHSQLVNEAADLLDELKALELDTEDALIMQRALESTVADYHLQLLLQDPAGHSEQEVTSWIKSIRGTLKDCELLLSMPGLLDGDCAAPELCSEEVSLRSGLSQQLVYLGDWQGALRELAEIEAFLQKYLAVEDPEIPDRGFQDEDFSIEELRAACFGEELFDDESGDAYEHDSGVEEEDDGDGAGDEYFLQSRAAAVRAVIRAVKGGDTFQVVDELRAAARGGAPFEDDDDPSDDDPELRRTVLSILNLAGWGARRRQDWEAFSRLGRAAASFEVDFLELCHDIKWAWAPSADKA